MAYLKAIYRVINPNAAEYALDPLEYKWGRYLSLDIEY